MRACACVYTCVCVTRVLVSSLPGNVRQRVRPVSASIRPMFATSVSPVFATVSAALPVDVFGFGKRRMMERKKKSKKRKSKKENNNNNIIN